jgi:hypothetical protein
VKFADLQPTSGYWRVAGRVLRRLALAVICYRIAGVVGHFHYSLPTFSFASIALDPSWFLLHLFVGSFAIAAQPFFYGAAVVHLIAGVAGSVKVSIFSARGLPLER